VPIAGYYGLLCTHNVRPGYTVVWGVRTGAVRTSENTQKTNFVERPSVLKNSFALFSALDSGPENANFVVFWPCSGRLLDRLSKGGSSLAGPPGPGDAELAGWLADVTVLWLWVGDRKLFWGRPRRY
jgi:hypothetical protein